MSERICIARAKQRRARDDTNLAGVVAHAVPALELRDALHAPLRSPQGALQVQPPSHDPLVLWRRRRGTANVGQAPSLCERKGKTRRVPFNQQQRVRSPARLAAERPRAARRSQWLLCSTCRGSASWQWRTRQSTRPTPGAFVRQNPSRSPPCFFSPLPGCPRLSCACLLRPRVKMPP